MALLGQEVIFDDHPEQESRSFYACLNCNRPIVLLEDCIRSFRRGRRCVEAPDYAVDNCNLSETRPLRCAGCNRRVGYRCVNVDGVSQTHRTGFSNFILDFTRLRDPSNNTWYEGRTLAVEYHFDREEVPRWLYACRRCRATPHWLYADNCYDGFRVNYDSHGRLSCYFLMCQRCPGRVSLGMRTIIAESRDPALVDFVEGHCTLNVQDLYLSLGGFFYHPDTMELALP